MGILKNCARIWGFSSEHPGEQEDLFIEVCYPIESQRDNIIAGGD